VNWNLTLPEDSTDDTEEIWVYQIVPGERARFVARFKYGRPRTNADAFIAFLQQNLTPEEYFAERDAGKAPLTILTDRGYVSPNMLYARAHP
jgi:hypothetical protein